MATERRSRSGYGKQEKNYRNEKFEKIFSNEKETVFKSGG